MARAQKRLLVLTVVGIITLNACDPLDPSGPLAVPDDLRFSLSPSEMTLSIGESATISPSLVRANGEAVNPQALKWSSTDPSRATVSRDGVVTAKAKGHPMIIASSGKIADTTRLRIVDQREPRAGVDISPDTVVLHWLNAKATLTATVRDDGGTVVAQPGLTWKSLNPGIAQIDDMGVVTAKGVGLALIVAAAACCDRADTAYARVDQVVDAVEIEQESVSLSPGGSVKLNSVAVDRGGTPVDGVTIEWRSADESVARVSQDGFVTSQSTGTTTVTATAEGHSDRATVYVTGTTSDGARSARYPNEPAGFEPWFVHDWQTFPATTDECVVPASGKGYMVFCGVSAHVERGTLIDDANAPHGFGKSLRVHWPAGLPVGHGMFNYAIRSTPHRSNAVDTSTPLQKWYISTWVYLEPENDGNWEMHFDQLRHFSQNRHITGNGRSIATWTFKGHLPYEGSSVKWGGDQRQSDLRLYRLAGRRCHDCSTTTLTYVNPGLSLGRWVHMELLFDRTVKAHPLFAEGSEDGIGQVHVRYWANGDLMLDRVIDDVYMSHPFMELFFNLNQSGGVAPSTDKYIRLSGTYISGELYQQN